MMNEFFNIMPLTKMNIIQEMNKMMNFQNPNSNNINNNMMNNCMFNMNMMHNDLFNMNMMNNNIINNKKYFQNMDFVQKKREKDMKFTVDFGNVINIKFSYISGFNAIISINRDRPLKFLFKVFAQKVGISEKLLGKGVIFLFNGLAIDVNNESPIHSLFPNNLNTIIVIFQKDVNGANNFNIVN